jgi:hypothetical protein
MTGEEDLDTVLRQRERGSTRREAGCVPAEIVAINGKTVNVKQLVDAITYDLDGKRVDIAPLDYEDVKYGAIGGQGIHIFIPPKVGMRGFMMVTDYDVADIEAGKVSQDRIRGRSSGVFFPVLEADYIEDIEIVNETGGKITLSKTGAIVQGTESGVGRLVLTPSGGDLICATSVVDAIKELNDIVKSCCGSSSPAAEGLTK